MPERNVFMIRWLCDSASPNPRILTLLWFPESKAEARSRKGREPVPSVTGPGGVASVLGIARHP